MPPAPRAPPGARPASRTSPLPSRIRRRQATNTKYVSASRARTTGAPKPAMTNPATAGPMSPDRLKDSDSIAFAVVRSPWPTSRVMRLGIPAALVMKRRP